MASASVARATPASATMATSMASASVAGAASTSAVVAAQTMTFASVARVTLAWLPPRPSSLHPRHTSFSATDLPGSSQSDVARAAHCTTASISSRCTRFLLPNSFC